jgi:ATP-dependent DNA helicase RecQ
VPDFARAVAARLELPFVNAVIKIRANQPQKLQQNRFHQGVNLDGAFEIAGGAPVGPVLLLDDVFDSGWTMTVVAALLRRAGVTVVWPVALAAATAGD